VGGDVEIFGVDEAGVSALAGPLIATAVRLGPSVDPAVLRLLRDSKKLATKQLHAAFDGLVTSDAVAFQVAAVKSTEVERLGGTLCARMAALSFAAAGLDRRLDRPITGDGMQKARYIVVDGAEVPEALVLRFGIQRVVGAIKGDGCFACVAAAGIISKVLCDNEMARLHTQFPLYGFGAHKGYATAAHRRAIEAHGVVEGVHRVLVQERWAERQRVDCLVDQYVPGSSV
jgi:ribonuclease HII